MRPIFGAWEANDIAMWRASFGGGQLTADFGRPWIDSDSLQLLLCVLYLSLHSLWAQNAWH